MNFRAQRYRGEQVLTWWEGEINKDGYGRGEYVIADDGYDEIVRFRAGAGRAGDFHEFQITPRNTSLVTFYRPIRHDLSDLGGAENGTALESFIQEIDIASGRVLRTWRASEHVPLTESHEPMPTDPDETLDFFHVNSVDVDRDGSLLVSARHTDTVYKIDRRSGAVTWRLGGKNTDFELSPGVEFFSQHDARRQPDGGTLVGWGSEPYVAVRAQDGYGETLAQSRAVPATD